MAIASSYLLLAVAILATQANAEFKLFNWVTSGDNDGHVNLRAKRATDDSKFTVIDCASPCTKAKSNEDSDSDESGSKENGGLCNCNTVEYNRRLSYLFILIHNMDCNTSGRLIKFINIALNPANTDKMSISIRIIIGMTDGDLLKAMSDFHQTMVNDLETSVSITESFKFLIEGHIPSSKGVAMLYTMNSSEREINKNNAMMIIVSALLNIRSALVGISPQDLLVQIQNKMPDNSNTQFFIDINNVILSIYFGEDSPSATPDLYALLKRETINVVFKYEIKFTEAQCPIRNSHEDSSDSSSDSSDNGSKSKKSHEKSKKSHEKSKKSHEKSKKSKKSKERPLPANKSFDLNQKSKAHAMSELSLAASKRLSKAHIASAKAKSKTNSKSKV